MLQEMEEREKTSLIVVKGLEVTSCTEFVEVFEDFEKYILSPDKVLQLSDIVSISRDKKHSLPAMICPRAIAVRIQNDDATMIYDARHT